MYGIFEDKSRHGVILPLVLELYWEYCKSLDIGDLGGGGHFHSIVLGVVGG